MSTPWAQLCEALLRRVVGIGHPSATLEPLEDWTFWEQCHPAETLLTVRRQDCFNSMMEWSPCFTSVAVPLSFTGCRSLRQAFPIETLLFLESLADSCSSRVAKQSEGHVPPNSSGRSLLGLQVRQRQDARLPLLCAMLWKLHANQELLSHLIVALVLLGFSLPA